MSNKRCFDCFHEFSDGSARFCVLKKMRDVDPEALELEPWLWSLCHDQVFVCADCAAWYGDQAMGPFAAQDAA